MCGIAGIVTKDEKRKESIGVMIRAAEHRGPNGIQIHIEESIALAHARLAIIDLSVAANQPMESWDGNYVIVFNGEIYNYIEIRALLEKKGHRFRSSSDTEVIIEAYRAWGATCVREFNGMWAFALYDRRARTVFCSRDRYGVKPFYYETTGNSVSFASEIKQLFADKSHSVANVEALSSFATIGLLGDGSTTCFTGIRQLPAGHNLLIDCETMDLRVSRYYRLDAATVFRGSIEDATDNLRTLLKHAIELRLRSDVPVGTCLSGGLDSSVIACIASELYGSGRERFRAITASSIDGKNDERRFAEEVCKYANLEWIVTRPEGEEVANCLETFMYHQDEPVASASPVMQYFVMQAAKRSGIPVLLDGQGADETLLGYGRYLGFGLRRSYSRGPLEVLRFLRDARRRNRRTDVMSIIKYAVGEAHAPLWNYFAQMRVPVKRKSNLGGQMLRSHSECVGDLQLYQRNEIESFSLPLLLRYEDRNSMAFGIETRLPFLDYRVVELCLSLPLNYKIRDGWTKCVLRRAAGELIPKGIAWRTDKIGFQAPLAKWIDIIGARMDEEIGRSECLAELLGGNPRAIVRSGVSEDVRWRLYSIALWAKMFKVNSLGWE